MSFDGVFRPAQLNAYAEPLSPYLGANQAAAEAAKRPRVKGAQKSEKITAPDEEVTDYLQQQDDEPEHLLPEEREQMLLFARLRGLLNFSLEEGIPYGFRYNEAIGQVELVNLQTDVVALRLTLEELLQISNRLQRVAGRIADQTA